MIKQLFEEKAVGNIPLSTFQKLLSDYNQEREDVEVQIREIEHKIYAQGDTERDATTWVGLIKNCLSVESLDRETAYRLIDKISVSEKIEEN